MTKETHEFSTAESAALKDVTVLYVEDDPLVRETAAYFLSGRVKELIVSADGVEGVFAFSKHNPDIVVTDIQMPKMDGIEMITHLRAMNPDLAVIITTHLHDTENLKRAVEEGINEYVLKPLESEKLLSAVNKCARTLLNARELANQKKLNEVMVHSLPFPAVLLRSSDKMILASNLIAEELGCRKGSPLETPLFPTDLGMFRHPIGAGLSLHAAEFRWPEVRAFDRVWEISLVPVAPDIMLFLAVDMTRRKAMEEALVQAEVTYRTIFENALEGIFLMEARGRFLRANHAMAAVLGYKSPDELLTSITDTAQGFFLNNEQREVFLADLEAAEHLSAYDMRVRRKDGSCIWLSLSVRGRYTDDGLVTSVEGLAVDVTARKMREMELKEKAALDDLTGLPNRYKLKQNLFTMIDNARTTGENFAVLYMDLDLFKHVNDQYGHHVGDIVLKEVADRIAGRLRRSDLAARIGGDEFVILLRSVEDKGVIETVAEELILAVSRPYTIENDEQYTMTASVGGAHYPDDDMDGEGLLRKADRAMYVAKQEGRNRFRMYSSRLETGRGTITCAED